MLDLFAIDAEDKKNKFMMWFCYPLTQLIIIEVSVVMSE